MKLILKKLKPRNPVAPAARVRRGGAHQPSAGGQRQKVRMALRREVGQLDSAGR